MDKTYGQIAYEAYCAKSDWKSLATGAPLPQYSETKPEIREAWEAAALETLRAAGNVTLNKDGDKFCACLGDDLATGLVGFGDTAADAVGALAFEMAKVDTAPMDDQTEAELALADEKHAAQMADLDAECGLGAADCECGPCECKGNG